ncbi:MAG: WD40 repeat domain-containing protein [Anaerolineae bacterium]|nr:WD40 repeat domain-containing protein [Anaerolineae bacterium]
MSGGLDGRSIYTLPHDASVTDARFSPDNKRVITTDETGRVLVWQLGTSNPKPIAPNRFDERILIAQFLPDANGKPDNRRLTIVTAGGDNTLTVWRWDTDPRFIRRTPVASQTFVGPNENVDVLFSAFSSDGRDLIVASDEVKGPNGIDGTVGTVWIWSMRGGGDKPSATFVHDSTVESAQFAPNGTRIVTVDGYRKVHFWDRNSNQEVDDPALTNAIGSINSATFSPGGDDVVTTDDAGTIRMWPFQGKGLTDNAGLLYAKISPDGRWVAAVSAELSSTVRLRRIDEIGESEKIGTVEALGERTDKVLASHSDAVVSVYFSSDGNRLITCSADTTAKVWDSDSGQLLATLSGHKDVVTSAQFSADGKHIITVGGVHGQVFLWNGETYAKSASLQEGDEVVTTAQFERAGGKRIATGDAAGVIRVWNSETGDKITTFQAHTDTINSLLFVQHESETELIVLASNDSLARVWQVTDNGGQLVATLDGHTGGVNEVQVSQKGRFIATVGAEGNVQLWEIGSVIDINTAENVKRVAQLADDEGDLVSAQFSPDDDRLVVRSQSRKLAIWNLEATPEQRSVKLPNEFRSQFEPRFKFNTAGTLLLLTVADDFNIFEQRVYAQDVVDYAKDLKLTDLSCDEKVKHLYLVCRDEARSV